ncbi:MAG: type II toxin-antitoxin system VapC family toxin [bacterium]|nr:type II toxin-antitoxin system VapC family toxin [bacterium]
MRICLDTSAYSEFKRGHPAAVETISSAREIGIPVIVLGELRTGFNLGKHRDRNEKELKEFLTHPTTKILDIEDETTVHYSEIIVQLRKAGKPLPTNDIWIAAVAAREGATVVTFDEHFEAIQRIGLLILKR